MAKINITEESALRYHSYPSGGNLETSIKKKLDSQEDFSLAYSPGVGFPCKKIAEDAENAYTYTNKGNLVGMISNGTSVLGLGNIGALASKPVMEGKGVLLKKLAHIDCFDIEINSEDPKRIIEVVEAISPTFGAINLEDIKAPECFEIEKELISRLDIPVMHDDQHGTAIVSAAALLNAIEIADKKIKDISVVVNGAGAAAIACLDLYISLGLNPENIVMLDTKGIISKRRTDLNEYKAKYATSRNIYTLDEAMRNADIFLGVSVANILKPEHVASMGRNPIILALANPTAEIDYYLAKSVRDDVIVATGGSHYPNQVNNVLAFPYVFRGALDVRASKITQKMKIAAAYTISQIAKLPIEENVKKYYNLQNLEFGPDYILPKLIDSRLLPEVSTSIAKAAIDSGVARNSAFNLKEYRDRLLKMTKGDS